MHLFEGGAESERAFVPDSARNVGINPVFAGMARHAARQTFHDR
ncbi:MAG: hypothetical protein ACC683_11320 [Acidimicrobiia bacterium]